MTDNPKLSHLSSDGQVRMVDVGSKDSTSRVARATATVHLGTEIAQLLRDSGTVSKGNVMETARIAGILAAKRTSELIPMCHSIPLDLVAIDMILDGNDLTIESTVRCHAATGVEMEALTAVTVASLTVYDMCKSAGKGMAIGTVRLLEKCGGRSGHWTAKDDG